MTEPRLLAARNVTRRGTPSTLFVDPLVTRISDPARDAFISGLFARARRRLDE